MSQMLQRMADYTKLAAVVASYTIVVEDLADPNDLHLPKSKPKTRALA